MLWKVARNDGQPAAARVAASRAILETTLRMTEVADLVERVAQLEEQLTPETGPRGGVRWGA